MIKALIRVRFRALFAALFQQSRRKRRQSKGMAVLFAILFIYVAFVFFGLFTIMFQQLVEPYHALGLDWLYFATAGLTGLAFSILGSVFATQSQLYDAKDNDLLLSMPIRPRLILFSRMVPLLALNLLFSAMSMVPAGVIYGANVGFAPGGFVAYLLSTLALPFLAQAITCLLGWLLHQLLQRMNKSLASALYLLVFMAVYFYVYTQASQLLNAMASNGEAMANALRSWAWPLYAMGQGCTGGLPFLAGFLAVTAAAFGLVYWFLSVTFMHSAFLRRSGADMTRVRKLFREKMEDYRAKAEALRSAEIFQDSFALAICPSEGIESPTIVGAQAANELLDVVGIKASIVFTKYEDKVYISARSIDEVNVQLIMERLGGGGHLSTAGTQLTGCSVEEAKELVKETILQMLEEGAI